MKLPSFFDFGSKDEPKDENQQTQYERELVNHVKSKVEEARSNGNRVANEGTWMRNAAYVIGFSNIRFNAANKQLEPINRVGSGIARNKIYINKILPTIQIRAAKFCKNAPKFDVLPNSNDPDDKSAAEQNLQVLEVMWEKLRLNEKRTPLVMQLQQTGHCYLKISWDPTMGEQLNDPTSDEIEYEGDVRADVVSAFETFPNPFAKSFDDVLKTYLTQARAQPLDYFKAQYPEKGHLVKEESIWLMSAQFENRINSLTTRGPGTGSNANSMKNCAMELIKYEARSKKHPNGRMIVVAGEILLEDKDLPFGEIPFAMFQDIQVAGKYNAEAVVTHLIPPQDQYNEIKRRIQQWENGVVFGKFIAARGSGLAAESMNDQSREIVYYNVVPSAPNGGAPTPLAIPVVPQYLFEDLKQLDSEINYIAGISEVSRGNALGANMPGVAIELLIESDDTRAGLETEQHEYAFARVGMMVLKCVEEGYSLPRKLKFSNQGNNTVVREISGDMIKNNTDVMVVRGSMTPGSKSLNRQNIVNTLKLGLLGNPADPKVQQKVLSMLEFGDVNEMFEKNNIIDSQIKRGMKEITEKGQRPVTNEWDDHAEWLSEMNEFRMTEKFNIMRPELQALFLSVMEEHVQWILKLTNQVKPAIPPEMQSQQDDLANQNQAIQDAAPVPESDPNGHMSVSVHKPQGPPL